MKKLTKRERQERNELYLEYETFLDKLVDEIFEEALGMGLSWLGLARVSRINYTTVWALGTRRTRLPQLFTVWRLAKGVGMDVIELKRQAKKYEREFA